MIKAIKRLRKRNKRILFLFIIALSLFSGFYFFNSKGATYTLPQITDNPNPNRKINNFLGKEFEWFLIAPDHVPIYIKEVGEGETIVTLHGGFGMTHDYLRSFMKPFEENFHVVYYDQRGSIRSSVPNNNYKKYITLENMVNDLELLRRALKVDKLNLVAHSMGALLAYEYMKRFPDQVSDLVVISGFTPKFPETNAEFHDLFTSQSERSQFSNRQEFSSALETLKQSLDTNSAEFPYLNWKLNSSSTQIYDINKWNQTVGGIGFFNPKINKLIGPESNIPWSYGLKFYLKQKRYNKGTLDTTNQKRFKSPINYLSVIENHPGKIDYLLGTHEIGDWNLRLYKRNIKASDKLQMHIFQNAGHNIWIDQPEAFHAKLSQILNN